MRFLLVLLLPLLAGGGTPPLSPLHAITHVTLVDGTGAPARADMTILMSNDRIVEVFRTGSRPLPRGVAAEDWSGRYVIPGLIDSHVHMGTMEERTQEIAEGVLQASLMGGVTAVRDMGGRGATVRPLAARAARRDTPWPRMYYSAIVAGPGRWFEGRWNEWMAEGGTPGRAPLVRRIERAEDIPDIVAGARAAGATGIKMYNTIDPRLLAPLTQAAHRAGLRVWSHLAVDPGKPSDVVKAGADGVSHADMFIREVLAWPPAGTPVDQARALRHRAIVATRLDTAPLQALVAEMRRRGTVLDPTLFVMRPRPDSSGRVDERGAALFHFAVGMVRRAHTAGVPIVAGTDGIGGSSPNLHVELQLLVDSAGLSPLEALTAATRNAARLIGADSIGTIEPGKLADLVILRADPIADIANTQTVEAVMKGGSLYRRTAALRPPPGARAPRQ